MEFKINSKYEPAGDQPQAIDKINTNLANGVKEQVLLGATGTGKTFTMANIIKTQQKKTLILAHNKALAAQLYEEFRAFFPENCVEFFVSYFDYYQPEVFVTNSNNFISKSSIINDDIDRMRHSATAALFESDQVVVISTVSCLFGLVNPLDYKERSLSVRPGQEVTIEDMVRTLKRLNYQGKKQCEKRMEYKIGENFLEVMDTTTNKEKTRIEIEDGKVSTLVLLTRLDIKVKNLEHFIAFDSNHYSPTASQVAIAIEEIEKDLKVDVDRLIAEGKPAEAQILSQRTNEDLDSLRKTGHSRGMENYVKYFSDFNENGTPFTLLDFFGDDWLLFIDESHVTVPQVKGINKSDRARKETLIANGYRLESALENRPLTYEEFAAKLDKVIYVSATPSNFELERVGEENITHQIIRPTGIIDPLIYIKSKHRQTEEIIEHLKVDETRKTIITTVTKKKAEELHARCVAEGLNVQYIHSGLRNTERNQILDEFKAGQYDGLIGINLLREGIDIPDVSCVLIMDADKAGFLRSKTALLQIIGRAARNSAGKVILYADGETEAIKDAIEETNIRRNKQIEANLEIKLPTDDKFEEKKVTQIRNQKEKLETELRQEILLAIESGNTTLSEQLKDILLKLERV